MSDLLQEIMDLPTEVPTEKAGKLKSYTVVYYDVDGALKEGWHHITEDNIDYVKEKYKKQGKDIAYFVERDK